MGSSLWLLGVGRLAALLDGVRNENRTNGQEMRKTVPWALGALAECQARCPQRQHMGDSMLQVGMITDENRLFKLGSDELTRTWTLRDGGLEESLAFADVLGVAMWR